MSTRLYTIIDGELRSVPQGFFIRANEYRAGKNLPLLKEISEDDINTMESWNKAQGLDMESAYEEDNAGVSNKTSLLILILLLSISILMLIGLGFGVAWLWDVIFSSPDITWLDGILDHRAAMISIETGIALLWGMLS